MTQRIGLGVALAIASTACFALLDTVSKQVGLLVPVVMAIWCRFAVQTLMTGLLLWPRLGRRMWAMQAPRWHVARGLLMLCSGSVAFMSLRHIPVGEFTAVLTLVPLVITLLASLLLHEHVSRTTWLLLIGGLCGALVIIRPHGDTFDMHLLWPLLLVLINASYQILTSRMVRTEDPGTMHFITGLICLVGASVLVPTFWVPVADPFTWLLIALMGVFGSLGHYVMIQAYQCAPASTLTPYMYAQIAFATLAGWVAFDHVPDATTTLGIALIVTCALLGLRQR